MDLMRDSIHSTPQPAIGRQSTFAFGRVIAASMIAFAIACGSDSGPTTPPEETTPVGSYTISTVNGKALPAAVIDDPDLKVEVTTGTLVLTTDGKYSSVLTTRYTIPGATPSVFKDSVGGSWILSGTNVELSNADDGSKSTAAWAGKQLTVPVIDGKVTTTYVYGKK